MLVAGSCLMAAVQTAWLPFAGEQQTKVLVWPNREVGDQSAARG